MQRGDRIFRLDEQGILKKYECYLDNERRNKKGKEISFSDLLQIKYRNSNIDDTTRARSAEINEWILKSLNVESDFVGIRNDPYSRGLEEYKAVFDNEIEQLANEYELKIGKKGYILDDIREKCEHVHGGTIYWWHDDGFKEEERWESGLDEKYYDPPQVCVETFEVKQYSFEVGKSFVCVTKLLKDVLPLGRANGSRFKGMIRKEIDTEGSVQKDT
ncbi:hypothetical protein Tco_0532382 [Tanacetum coccineum]